MFIRYMFSFSQCMFPALVMSQKVLNVKPELKDFFHRSMYQTNIGQLTCSRSNLKNQVLPQLLNCLNICVTTDDKALFSHQGTESQPVPYQVITVVDSKQPLAEKPNLASAKTRTDVRQIVGSRQPITTCESGLFMTPAKQLEEVLPLKSTCVMSKTSGDISSKAAPSQGSVRLANISQLRDRIRRLSEELKESKKRATENLKVQMEQVTEQVSPQVALQFGDKISLGGHGPLVSPFRKKFRKKKKKKPNLNKKKKVNLRNFKQQIPIAGTSYVMELYLSSDIIEKTRKGHFEFWKEPKIRVVYSRGADLRDEYASYCGQRKTIKNWLFYV